jgi:hypothetical protein
MYTIMVTPYHIDVLQNVYRMMRVGLTDISRGMSKWRGVGCLNRKICTAVRARTLAGQTRFTSYGTLSLASCCIQSLLEILNGRRLVSTFDGHAIQAFPFDPNRDITGMKVFKGHLVVRGCSTDLPVGPDVCLSAC